MECFIKIIRINYEYSIASITVSAFFLKAISVFKAGLLVEK